MKTTIRLDETFGMLLKRLRQESGHTLRSLGDVADVPHSTIAAFESDRQGVSPELASRLSDALAVQDRDTFLLKAASATKRRKILPFARGYRAEVLNYLAGCLAGAGIMPRDVKACYFSRPPFNDESVDGNFITDISDKVKKGQVQRMNFQEGRGKFLSDTHLILETKQGGKVAIAVMGTRA